MARCYNIAPLALAFPHSSYARSGSPGDIWLLLAVLSV